MADKILADANASGIYQIRNLVNGKRYIGSAKCFRKRWAGHRSGFKHGNHPNLLLRRSWVKHGADAFVFEILETCSVELLLVREQHWIDSRSPEYNLSPTAGNCLGVKHSPETRRKCSERNRGNKYCVGRKLSDATKNRIGRANKGKRKGIRRDQKSIAKTVAAHLGAKRSEETRRRISEARLGKKMPPRTEEHRANLSRAMRDRAFSPEHMAAFHAGRLSQVFTVERRAKLSESLKVAYADGRRKREKSEEHKNRIGQHYAKLTDDQVREIRKLRSEGVTGRELAKRFGSNGGTISAICSGKRYRWVA